MKKNKTFISDDELERRANHAYDVISRTNHLPAEGIKGFEWPEFTHERARIKANNEKYRNMDLVDVMYACAGVKKPTDKVLNRLRGNDECRELKVGDIISLKIVDINKKGVVFDNSVYKEDITCNVNLYQYDKLRHFLPKDPIRCKVMSKQNNNVTVDPFVVMFDEWLDSRLDDSKRGKVPARSQYNINTDQSTIVKNLRLLKGGYAGIVRIDTISDFVGQDIYADAFIPGSQIVLNIENDFSRWEGMNVNAFVFNYMKRPGTANAMSVVCSVKEVLKFKGQQNMIKIFSDYAEDNKQWHALQKIDYTGIVTGVLKSAKKCGVFVEIEDLNITGMIEVPANELVNYHPQDKLKVRWSHFDEPMRWNKDVEQFQHIAPYVVENGILKEFNIKPIFKVAKDDE